MTAPKIFSATRQLAFHQLLVGARRNWLADALREALGSIDPNELKKELSGYVSADAQRLLAEAGIRDEFVFPTPLLLRTRPTLVGYYRLLLGVSQKEFYRSGTGMAPFKSMETVGTLSQRQDANLDEFCQAMCRSLAELVLQLSPKVTPRDVSELPLLTLGSQFQGANNVAIGKQATVEVFLAIVDLVAPHVVARTQRELSIMNASNRRVIVAFSSDPDVRIQEEFNGVLRNKVAIEIKGGADVSNVHNRAGEAEKSHQKARSDGFRDFWTIISLRGVSVEKLHAESPTTNSWFDLAQVVGRDGEDWDEFRSRVVDEVGIPTER